MTEKEIRERDYQNGLKKELDIFNKLRKRGNIVETTNRYNYFDCKINNRYVCEIKSRSCSKNTYAETILPYSKILEYKKVKKDYEDLVIIFHYKDGDFYTTYRDLVKNKSKIAPFTRYSGFQHQTKDYVFIPVKILKPLNELVLCD